MMNMKQPATAANGKLFLAAIVAGLATTAAQAQTTTFDQAGAAAEAVDDLQEQIREDQERDLIVFGTEGREIGQYGSIALRYTATTNRGDTGNNLGVGLRYGTFDGVNGFDFNASYVLDEENGTVTDNRLLAGAIYRRNLSDTVFAYGQLDTMIDRLADNPGDYLVDTFVGAGLGYRIYNTNTAQWSVQAGPGYRVAEVFDRPDVSEVAASLSSNLYVSLTDTVYLTNDTDVIYSDSSTVLSNDLALNVALTDTLALRTSYATRFNDATDNSFSDGVNTLGVSVVYSFN